MKAQFKYAFLTGLNLRIGAFAVICAMNFVFIVLGSLGLLPFAAHVTAVSLGGIAIAVMLAFNIVSDISIVGRMFSAPGAYLYALTPAPRWKTLLPGVIAMFVLDAVTMTVVIAGEVWLSFNLAGDHFGGIIREAIVSNVSEVLFGLWYVALLCAGYLLVVMMIVFCVSVKKSLLHGKRTGGVLTTLLAGILVYAVSLSPLLLTPLGTVNRFGLFFVITLGRTGTIMYVLLTFVQAAILFVLSASLMERKINI